VRGIGGRRPFAMHTLQVTPPASLAPMPLPQTRRNLLASRDRHPPRRGRHGHRLRRAALAARRARRAQFLLPELAARPDIASRFSRKPAQGRRISSHHVAKVTTSTASATCRSSVMEHLDGETLAAHLARRGCAPVDERSTSSSRHARRSTKRTRSARHRDLKPGESVPHRRTRAEPRC